MRSTIENPQKRLEELVEDIPRKETTLLNHPNYALQHAIYSWWSNNEHWHGTLTLTCTTLKLLPFDISLPLYIMIFKKRKSDDPIPTYMISFYFGNNVINLPLMLHEQDVITNDEVQIILPPPYFLHDRYLQEPVLDHGVKDFASPEKVTDERDEIVITLPEDYQENLTAYDSLTDATTQRSFDGTPFKHIIFTRRM